MILRQENGRHLTHRFFRRTPGLIKKVVEAAISTAARQGGRSSSVRITFGRGRLEALFHAPRHEILGDSLAWCPLLCLPFTIRTTRWAGLQALRTLSRPIPRIQLITKQYDIRDEILQGSTATRLHTFPYPKWTAAGAAIRPKPDLWLCYSAYHLRGLLRDPSIWNSDDQRDRVRMWCRDINFNSGVKEWALQERLMSSMMLESITMPQLRVYMRIGARLLFCRSLESEARLLQQRGLF